MSQLNRWGMAASLLMVMLVSTVAAAKQKAESRDAKAVRSVLERQVEAWNRRDLEGFMRGYWRSADLTFFSNATTTSGWKETLDRYRNRYQSEGAEMGRLTFSDLKVEILGPGSAFVRGRWQLKMAASEPGGLFTLIFRKFNDGWKIVHDHTGSS